MPLQFDLKMIDRYGFTRYRKAKLLAKAIRKANMPDGCCHKSQYWLKIAESLSGDESVPTEYVPVRMMIASLENGYLNLVLNLYGQPELVPTKEMQKRIADLYQDLLLLHTGSSIVLGTIERAHQIIDVISAFYIIRFANLEDSSQKSAKDYVKLLSLNNKRLNMEKPEIIDNMIEKIVRTKFDVPQSAKDGLVNLVKLVPIQNITENYQKGYVPNINIKRLFDIKYPFDYIKDEDNWEREVDAWRILGVSQYLIDKQICQTIKSPILSKKPIKFRQINHIYERILEFKKQGLDLNVVGIKLQIEGIYLRSDDIMEIYKVISDDCPEPDVLYSRSTKSLGLSQELVNYIRPSSPHGAASPKNVCHSLESHSPRSDYNDKDLLSGEEGSIKLKNNSLKKEPNSKDDNSSTKNKRLIKIHPIDDYSDESNLKDNDSPVKSKMSIKIDPTDGFGEVIYCSPASHKDDNSHSILGANDDISEEFL